MQSLYCVQSHFPRRQSIKTVSNEEEKLLCCICLFNRLRGFETGVPTLDQIPVFDSFPWEQRQVFLQDFGICAWLFFKIPPGEYRQIRKTRFRWKIKGKDDLIVTGLQSQQSPVVTMTNFSLSLLRTGDEHDPDHAILSRRWTLHLFQTGDYYLYCLKTKNGPETTPVTTTIDRNKIPIHPSQGGSSATASTSAHAEKKAKTGSDAFALPMEGTDTRVNAQADAYEYMVEYSQMNKLARSLENVVGWPGYGCLLWGTDVSTQRLNQQDQEPFLAVVVDSTRTVSAVKVDIGAFRTYSEGYKPPDEAVSEYQTIPMNKIEDFGVHYKQYYSLDVTCFKSPLDSHLLDLLWNKYWVNNLSSSPLLGNGDYVAGQISDLAEKLEQAENLLAHSRFGGIVPSSSHRKKEDGSQLTKITRDSSKITVEQVHELMSQVNLIQSEPELLGMVASTSYASGYFLNLHKATGHPVLVYMAAGNLAQNLEKLSDEATADFVMLQLKKMFPDAPDPFALSHILGWDGVTSQVDPAVQMTNSQRKTDLQQLVEWDK